jgi:hypothetical protein
VKAQPPLGIGREHPVDHGTVKVNRGVERRAEPVQEGDRPKTGPGTRPGTRRVKCLLHPPPGR